MSILSKLWEGWIAWTYTRAKKKQYRDKMLFGNGWMQRKWWGFVHIPAQSIYHWEQKE